MSGYSCSEPSLLFYLAMNASLKLRDDQLPLLKLKLPVTLLGIPLVSRITAGNDQDLAFRLGTAFRTGPACEISYRPKDGTRLLSLALKLGACQWGSSAGAMVAMSAEFNLLGGSSRSPVFRLRVTPQAGDLSLRKDFVSAPFEGTVRLHERRLEMLASESPVFRSRVTPQAGDLSLRKDFVSVPFESTVRLHERVIKAEEDASFPSPSPGESSHVGGLKGSASFPGASPPSSSSSSSSFSRDALHVRADYDWENIESTETRKSAVTESLPQYDKVEEDTSLPLQKHDAKKPSLSSFFANAHLRAFTSLRIRRNALLQIRWRANIPSDTSYKIADFTSLSRCARSLSPFFLVDKIKLESVTENINLTHQEASEAGLKLAQLQALCLSTRNVLYSVQVENEALKREIVDMRRDFGSKNITSLTDQWSSIEIAADGEDSRTSKIGGY